MIYYMSKVLLKIPFQKHDLNINNKGRIVSLLETLPSVLLKNYVKNYIKNY